MRRLSFTASTLLAAALAASRAHAAGELVLRQRITIATRGNDTRDQTLYYAGPIRVTDDERARTIADLNNGTLTIINKKDQTYSVVTFTELKNRRDSHDQRVKDLPPQMRDVVKADSKVQLKPTGKSETIAGYQAREYSVDTKGLVGTVWIADQLDLGPRADDWNKLAAVFGGQSSPGGHLDEALSKLKGVPLRRILTMEPLPLVTTEVLEVSHNAPPAEMLRVPEGYKKVEPPSPKKPAPQAPPK